MKHLVAFGFIATLTLSAYAKIHVHEISGFNLVTQSQSTLSLKDSSKYRVFYFLNTLCPCVQAHFDHLNNLILDYPQFDFVGFNSNKFVKKDDAIKFYGQFKINFPVFLDSSLQYANLFKAVKTPHVFVLDKNGEIVFQGATTNSRDFKTATQFYLKDALAALARNKTPKIANAKTLGCYIQR